MSEKSMALSGCAASFARRRLRAGVRELVESFFRTIFVIALALLSRGFAGGDDANDFLSWTTLDRVSYQQQRHASDKAEGLPAKLAALDAVLLDEGKGIGEDQHGVLETNAVFAFVGPGLGVVPLEPDHTTRV